MSRSPKSSIVAKCAAILDVVSLSRRPLAFSDIVEKTGFVKSSCHRVLAVLQSEEMIAYNTVSRTYSAGPRLKQWARNSLQRTDLLDVSAVAMDALSETTGMNTALTIVDDHSILYLRTTDLFSVRLADRPGDSAPLYCTAAGKVFLAHLSNQRRAQMLDSIRLEKYTESTISDLSELDAQFSDVLTYGYGRAICEEHVHVMGIASPIWNAQNQVAACLSLWATTNHMAEQDIDDRAPMLIVAARAISSELGWEDASA